jgi:hypothetical protein
MSRIENPTNPSLWDRLVELPQLCYEFAETLMAQKQGQPAARWVQRGIALDMQLCCPMRWRDLARLHAEDHLRFDESETPISLKIPAVYRGVHIKSGCDLERMMGERVSKYLKIYLALYPPVLDPNKTWFLFPSNYKRHMSAQQLRGSVGQFVDKQLGTGAITSLIQYRIVT